jgi:hypothetical protein
MGVNRRMYHGQEQGADVEDLIRDIQERTGLSTETVLEVVTMVTDYMRNALPEDLIAQVTTHLGNAAESAAAASTSASEVIGRTTELASAAFSTTVRGLTDLANGNGTHRTR